jgi:cardiolipin synthase A/B
MRPRTMDEPRDPPAERAQQDPTPGRRPISIERYIDAPEQLVAGNRIALQRNGSQAFPAWLSAIDGAKHRISMEMYIFAGDATGQRFADALIAACKRGVVVRLLYDHVGCRDTNPSFFERLRQAGVRVSVYHRIRTWRPHFWRLFRRNHRKTIVVDGTIAFVGGLNLADEWAPQSQNGGDWIDLAVAVQGPAVGNIEAAFAKTWNHRNKKRYRLDLGTAPKRAGDTPIAVLANGEFHDRFTIRRGVIHAVQSAENRIWIANGYFMPDRGILRALRKAALGGIDVRILIAKHTDSRVVDLAVRSHLSPLLRDGVKIFMHPTFVHSKAMLVDDGFVSIGTYNMDHRSLSYNLEMVLNTLDVDLAKALAETLTEDIKAAEPLNPVAFANRSILDRILERLAFLLRKWL